MSYDLDSYDNDRLICKHFNLSWTDLRDDICWGDYMCLLATALDAEEREDYKFVMFTHGSDAVKKWKWQSSDKGGTVKVDKKDKNDVNSTMLNFAQNWQMITTGQRGPLKATGSAELYAEVSGRPIGYLTKEGLLVDKQGNSIEKTDYMIIVRQ